jgi:hypothetical protein
LHFGESPRWHDAVVQSLKVQSRACQGLQRRAGIDCQRRRSPMPQNSQWDLGQGLGHSIAQSL